MPKPFASIKRGLTEAIQYSEGKCPRAVVHEFASVDVKNIRSGLKMSQTEFAATFGISISTLRRWEKGDRIPRGPALVLLNVAAKRPKAVLDALAR